MRGKIKTEHEATESTKSASYAYGTTATAEPDTDGIIGQKWFHFKAASVAYPNFVF